VIIYQRETVDSIKDDAKTLFQKDWDETNIHAEKIGLKMDVEAYYHLEKMGRLFVLSAREEDDKKIVGYIGFIVSGSMQHSELTAACTGLFIDKEYRGKNIAKTLILKALSDLKDAKIRKISISSSPKHDIGPILKPYGFDLEELVYTLVI